MASTTTSSSTFSTITTSPSSSASTTTASRPSTLRVPFLSGFSGVPVANYNSRSITPESSVDLEFTDTDTDAGEEGSESDEGDEDGEEDKDGEGDEDGEQDKDGEGDENKEEGEREEQENGSATSLCIPDFETMEEFHGYIIATRLKGSLLNILL